MRRALVNKMKELDNEITRLFVLRDGYEIGSIEYDNIDNMIHWCQMDLADLEEAMWDGLDN